MQNSLNHKLPLYFLTLVFCVAGVLFIHYKIAVPLTPSLKYTIFYLREIKGDEIMPGNYVRFTLNHPTISSLKFKKTIKKAVCVGGQELTVVHKDYYCNGVYLGTAKEYSLKGEMVDNFKYNGIIPAGSLFVMGHSKNSFDSRYFGFIRMTDVEKVAIPLI